MYLQNFITIFKLHDYYKGTHIEGHKIKRGITPAKKGVNSISRAKAGCT